MDIRPATDADLGPIRRLHTESWRDAYAPFVPADALARLDGEMAARWTDLPDGVFCAWVDDRLTGFIRLKQRDGWPYIDNLHTLPACRGAGIGASLMAAAISHLRDRGLGRVWLTVISANHGARRFYARQGGDEAGPMVEAVLGHPVSTRAVIWNRLPR